MVFGKTTILKECDNLATDLEEVVGVQVQVCGVF